LTVATKSRLNSELFNFTACYDTGLFQRHYTTRAPDSVAIDTRALGYTNFFYITLQMLEMLPSVCTYRWPRGSAVYLVCLLVTPLTRVDCPENDEIWRDGA